MVMVLAVVVGVRPSTRLATVTLTRRRLRLRRRLAPLRLSLKVSFRLVPAGVVKRARPITIRLVFGAPDADAVAVSSAVQGSPPAGQDTVMPGSTSTVRPTALEETRPDLVTDGWAR